MLVILIKGPFKYMYLDNYNFLRLYTSLVKPHLGFANVVWYLYHCKDIESLEQVQMRAIKFVSTNVLKYWDT